MSISAIVGLGNVGLKYCTTRHNIGFQVADACAQQWKATWSESTKFKAHLAKTQLGNQVIHLIKPTTMMNLSGESIGAFARFFRIPETEILVIYDEINLDIGCVKLSVKGGSSGHNGIENIFEHVGRQFIRYRIGVGAKAHPEMELKDHVLSNFNDSERTLLSNRMSHYVFDLQLVLRLGVERAMNQINQRNRNYDTSSHKK